MRLGNSRSRLRVLITIDTEVWPRGDGSNEHILHEDLGRDIYGCTHDGEYGIRFQSQLFCDHNLKVVFFVESSFASVVGFEPLREIIKLINSYHHDVELHIHPEWLERMAEPIFPGNRRVQFFHQLQLEHQRSLLLLGRENLMLAGAQRVRAFRAGNYGANFDTLRALQDVGILQDFSYNAALLDKGCRLHTPVRLCAPTAFDGVIEFPTAHFVDYRDHVRPAQLCACSSAEMEYALEAAWRSGWSHFVILTHSFEFIHRESSPPRLNRTVLNRAEQLVAYLERNNDRFETVGCDDCSVLEAAWAPQEIHGRLTNTAARYLEQAWKRYTA